MQVTCLVADKESQQSTIEQLTGSNSQLSAKQAALTAALHKLQAALDAAVADREAADEVASSTEERLTALARKVWLLHLLVFEQVIIIGTSHQPVMVSMIEGGYIRQEGRFEQSTASTVVTGRGHFSRDQLLHTRGRKGQSLAFQTW